MKKSPLLPLFRLVRLIAREAWSLALSQPHRLRYRRLHRLDPRSQVPSRPGAVPVVFVHGYAQNCATFRGMAARLAQNGVGPLYAFNYWSFTDVRLIARRLHDFIERVREETGAAQVDLVCHSMGGIVAAEHLMQTDGACVRRCVTIATPHAGVSWRGPILGACGQQLRAGCEYLRRHFHRPFPVPLLSIASENDTLFFQPNSAAVARRGGHDVVLRGHGHLSLLFAREVIDLVHEFLRGVPVTELPGVGARRPSLPPPPTPLADAAE